MKRSRRKVELLFLVLIFSSYSYTIAHNEVIEGLYLQLENTSPIQEKEKINLLNQLSYEYYQIDIEKTFSYAEEALNRSKAINYKKGIAQAYKYLAIGNTVKKNIPKSIEFNQAALEIALEINDTLITAHALNGLGLDFATIGLYDKAVPYYLESLDYSTMAGNDRLRCFTNRNLGLMYEEMGDQEKAMEYFKKGAELAKHSDHHMIRYIPYLTWGDYYRRNKKYKKALENFKKAYGLCTNNYSRAVVLQETALVYEVQENWASTAEYLQKALALIEESGNDRQLEKARLALAKVHFKRGNYPDCLQILEDIEAEKGGADGYSYRDKIRQKLFAETYHQIKQHEKAIFYYGKFIEIQDSIYDRDRLDLITALEAKYQIEEKENENEYLRQQQTQSKTLLKQRNRITQVVVLLSILISFVALLLFKAYQNKRRFNRMLQERVSVQTEALMNANNQLKSSNIELERFAYIASHDLKEPLRNISSFSSLLERKLSEVEEKYEMQEYLDFIKSNADQMHQLIQEVLEYSRADDRSKNQLTETNLNELVDQVQQAILTDIKEQNVEIKIVNPSPDFHTSISQMFLVLKNLVSNGIKYNTASKKIIEIGYLDQGERHLFYVKDNGIGIEPEYRDQIFEMFKRLHNKQEYQGSGLGLAICKKIVLNMGGEIWCESSQAGSTFYFNLPKQTEPEIVAE